VVADPDVPVAVPGLGYRYLDRVDGRLYERVSGQAIGFTELRDLLRQGARIRVISQPAGVDCTIDVLLEMLAPILARAGGLRGLFNVNIVTGDNEPEPGAAADGARHHTGRRLHPGA
jgi:hypothetical protein